MESFGTREKGIGFQILYVVLKTRAGVLYQI